MERMATLFEMGLPATASPLLDVNEAQRRAITHGAGPLLVIAGAGTGKTRVITERIRHLLENDASLAGENILGLTFTKKAAGEMKARVVKAVGERGKDVTLGDVSFVLRGAAGGAGSRPRDSGQMRSLDFIAAQSGAVAAGEIPAAA